MMRWIKLTVGTVTVVLPVSITVLDTFGYVAKVEGASMQPVLNPDGKKSTDYVFLNKWLAKSARFSRGEVVALKRSKEFLRARDTYFRCPTNPKQKLIKRIIAMDGDNVRTRSYKEKQIKIPSGHCWVEGDHHKHSLDSNFFGPVSQGLITAKATHIVWPPRRWQRLTYDKVDHKKRLDDELELFDDDS